MSNKSMIGVFGNAMQFYVVAIFLFSSLIALGGLESIGGGVGNYTERRRVRPPEGYALCDKCEGKKVTGCISCKGVMRGRKCIRCDGLGSVKCGKCNGTGYLKTHRTTLVRPQRNKQEDLEAVRLADKNVLRQKLQTQKMLLRSYVRENDIVCTSRVQLAEMNLALIRKCKEEDRSIKKHLENEGFSIKFTTDAHPILGAEKSLDDGEKFVSIIVFQESSFGEILNEMKLQQSKMKSGLEREITKPTYYKKFCDVHKWDDECCPRFGGDYFTEDMKTKYASNKMQAYEMEKKGVIKCKCFDLLPNYNVAMAKYEKEISEQKRAVNELSARYLTLRNEVAAFRNSRFEEEQKLKAMEKADEMFAVIVDLVKNIKSL